MKVLTSLRKLDMSSNKVGSLPVECAKAWHNLSHLELRDNTLFALPNEVEKMQALSYLGVQQNQLERIRGELEVAELGEAPDVDRQVQQLVVL